MQTIRDMKKINSREDFLFWAKTCNINANLHTHNHLQDILGHSNLDELKKIFKNAEDDWRMLLFAIYKTQDDDTFFEFLNVIISKRIEIMWEIENDQLQAEWSELGDQKFKANERERSIEGKLADLMKAVKTE